MSLADRTNHEDADRRPWRWRLTRCWCSLSASPRVWCPFVARCVCSRV